LPNLSGGREGEYLTDRLTAEAEKFIEENRRRPFFVYLAHYAVHTSIGNRLQAKPGTIAKYTGANPNAAQHNPVYAAMIESMDDSVGRILKKLDDLRIANRTVVVFTSDNGGYHQATAQPPLRGAKSEAYEGGIRVPLIIRWPGVVKPGTVCETPVISVDFFPTVAEITGLTPPPTHKVDGVSLVPLLRGTGKLQREAIFWHYPHYNDATTPHSIVRQGDFKLIEYFEDGRLELFNLRTDIGEKENLAAARPAKAWAMQQRLIRWREQVGAQVPRPKSSQDPSRQHGYLDRYGKGRSDEFKRKVVGDGWIERYQALLDGMRAELVSQHWRKHVRLVGDGAFPPVDFGPWAG
jgi:arylsulfatase A-like enzyme